MLGNLIPKFNNKNWIPGIIITSTLFTFTWGYLVYTGNIRSIWPLFGISNQLLAACALIIVTTMLIRMNRGRYSLCTAIPGLFMVVITMWAGYIQVTDNYVPNEQYLLATLTVIAMVLVLAVLIGAFRKWIYLMSIKGTVTDSYGEEVKELVKE